jgi:hypothetical protein
MTFTLNKFRFARSINAMSFAQAIPVLIKHADREDRTAQLTGEVLQRGALGLVVGDGPAHTAAACSTGRRQALVRLHPFFLISSPA